MNLTPLSFRAVSRGVCSVTCHRCAELQRGSGPKMPRAQISLPHSNWTHLVQEVEPSQNHLRKSPIVGRPDALATTLSHATAELKPGTMITN